MAQSAAGGSRREREGDSPPDRRGSSALQGLVGGGNRGRTGHRVTTVSPVEACRSGDWQPGRAKGGLAPPYGGAVRGRRGAATPSLERAAAADCARAGRLSRRPG